MPIRAKTSVIESVRGLVVDGVVAASGRHRALLRDDATYRAVVTREEVTTQ